MTLALLFLSVFALNVLPAFAPPTWMALSFYGLRHPDALAWQVALVAALSATGGRVVLALGAQRIARSRWVSAARRDHLAAVAELVGRQRAASVAAFLLFAFSPLPSNVLFMAYGLARAPLPLLVLPFFIGRLASYTLAFTGGMVVAREFDLQITGPAALAYFIVTQLAMLAAVWLFGRIDWRHRLGGLLGRLNHGGPRP